jgi:hypothetical protein
LNKVTIVLIIFIILAFTVKGIEEVYAPHIAVIVPDSTETTPQVFFKEHSDVSSASVTYQNPNVSSTQAHDNSAGNQGRTAYFLFPNIDAKYVNGKEVQVRWQINKLSGGGSTFQHLEVWEGHYDGTNQTRWVSATPVVNVVVDTPITFSTTTQRGMTTDTAILNTTTATTDEVTIALILRNSGSNDSIMNVQYLEIVDYADWSTVHGERLCNTIVQTKSATTTDEYECQALRGGLVVDAFAEVATQPHALAEDEWNLREQELTVASVINCNFLTPPLELESLLPNEAGYCHAFKVFNATDIINKNLTLDWDGSGGAGLDIKAMVLDGSYDRTNSADFPISVNAIGFTDPLKGAGILNSINHTVGFSQIEVLNMTLTGATLPEVTVVLSLFDGSNSFSYDMDTGSIEISDVGKWEWDISSSINMTITGTQNDQGVATANFTDLTIPPDSTPPVITADVTEPITVIQNSSYDRFSQITCIDDTDGVLVFPDLDCNPTCTGSFDTSQTGLQNQDFICVDNASNQGFANIEFIVKRQSSGGASFDAGGGGGVQTSLSQLEDVPPLTQPTTPPTDVDRAFSLFDQLNSFFDRPETQEAIDTVGDVAIDAGERVTSEVQERLPETDSFVQRITDFFSGLFGFLYGYEVIPKAFADTQIDNFQLKFVITFNMTGTSVGQITNYVTNVLYPPMRDDLIIKLDNNFINYTLSKSLRVHNLVDDRYQVYPKVLFSGNTTLTKEQLRTGLDVQLDDWFTIVEASLATNNAFDVKYHMHKSIGSIDVNGAL